MACNALIDVLCERNPHCVRGFRHLGRGGKCSTNASKCLLQPRSSYDYSTNATDAAEAGKAAEADAAEPAAAEAEAAGDSAEELVAAVTAAMED